MTKPTKWVCAQRRQISLGIRPVWSESSLSAWRKLGSLATHWAHTHFVGFVMSWLIWYLSGHRILMLKCEWIHMKLHFRFQKTYRKFPKYSDTQNICCNHFKILTMWLYHRVMSPNDADGMANSVDPDQTAPLGAVWSGSALFAQAYLSKNLGTLR